VERATAEQRSIRHTPHSKLVELSTQTLGLMQNPAIAGALKKAVKGPTHAFFALAEMAESGRLDNWHLFQEFAETLVEVVDRQEDPTGNAMKGMRFKDSILALSTVLRSYGAGSSVSYGVVSGFLPVPSFRQIKCVRIPLLYPLWSFF
jgi:hypothetical protein